MDDACRCGHREYDHLTVDGTCWKCKCPKYDPSKGTER